jgi:hypothetical protein
MTSRQALRYGSLVAVFCGGASELVKLLENMTGYTWRRL